MLMLIIIIIYLYLYVDVHSITEHFIHCSMSHDDYVVEILERQIINNNNNNNYSIIWH